MPCLPVSIGLTFNLHILLTCVLDIIRELKLKDPAMYKKTQTTFAGNISSVRAHIARQGDAHYERYIKYCHDHNIEPNHHATPIDVKERLERLAEGIPAG